MKKEVWWLENRNALILYLRAHRIRIRCVFKKVMMKQKGIVGSGLAISFLMRKKIPESDMYGNIIEVEQDAPTSRFRLKTKRKVMALLELTQDSSVADCEKINNEIERSKEK